jgi:membrane-associated phospholipid phosphatase
MNSLKRLQFLCIKILLLIFIVSNTLSAQSQGFKNPYLFSSIGFVNFNPIPPLNGNAFNQRNVSVPYQLKYNAVANQSTSANPNLGVFDHFGQNFLNSFKGDNLYLQLAGIASTALIVTTNTDYHVEKYFNEHEVYTGIARPVVFSGMFLPFIASGSLYAYAKIKNDNEVLGASFAVMQATITEFLYNSLLKAITGRPHPDWQHTSDMKSLSKTFRFGFNRGGIFWGWPSGHTAATTAVVSALMGYYPNSTWLKVAGFSLMAYTIFGVSAFHRGGMHWFSDAVAAAFMSYAVGSTIGKYYRSRFSNTGSQSTSMTPLVGNNLGGLSFSIQF